MASNYPVSDAGTASSTGAFDPVAVCRDAYIERLKALPKGETTAALAGQPRPQAWGEKPKYMLDDSCSMKVVQTKLAEQEYRLLAEYAARIEKSLQETLREAIVC